MTADALVNTPLLTTIIELVGHERKIAPNEIGMIVPIVERKAYTKNGIEYIGHKVVFDVYDLNARHLAVVTQKQLKEYNEKRRIAS